MNSLPLKNVRILDLTALLPGPLCTMMLAEMGAEVIRLEKPEGVDLVKLTSPVLYNYLNGGKKVITLDLKKKEGIQQVKEMIKTVDVFVEGFRPGVVKRLGIDFESLKRVNPSIIYGSISGYGQTGPNVHLPGHDINYQAITGLFSICGDPDGEPEFPSGIQTADIAGTMFLLSSILAALHKPKDSPAVFLDVSMANSMAMWMMPRYLEYLARQKPSKDVLMGRGAYGIFKTKDDQFLSLGVVEPHFWINLCKAMGFDDWIEDKSFMGWTANNAKRHLVVPRLQKTFKEKDLDYWLDRLTAADVPVSRVRNIEDWVFDAQFEHSDFIPHNPDGSINQDHFRRFPIDFNQI